MYKERKKSYVLYVCKLCVHCNLLVIHNVVYIIKKRKKLYPEKYIQMYDNYLKTISSLIKNKIHVYLFSVQFCDAIFLVIVHFYFIN